MIFGQQELWFFLLTGFVKKIPTWTNNKGYFLKEMLQEKKGICLKCCSSIILNFFILRNVNFFS